MSKIVKKQFESNSQRCHSFVFFVLSMSKIVKKQFESNSQHIFHNPVIKVTMSKIVKKQFESNLEVTSVKWQATSVKISAMVEPQAKSGATRQGGL